MFLLNAYGKSETKKEKEEKIMDYDMIERVASLYIASKADKGTPKKYLSGMKGKERKKRVNEIERRQKETDPKKKFKPFKTDEGAKTRKSQYSKTEIAEKIRGKIEGRGKDAFIEAAASVSGVSKKILSEVYARGSAAWAGGHRPGATQQQWSIARVYSFLSGGKTQSTADRDLAEEAGLL